MESRKDVCERFLQSERDRHAADARCREDGSDGDAVVLEDDENPHCVDDANENAVEQRRLWQIFVRSLEIHGDDAVYGTRNHACDGQHVACKEEVGK